MPGARPERVAEGDEAGDHAAGDGPGLHHGDRGQGAIGLQGALEAEERRHPGADHGDEQKGERIIGGQAARADQVGHRLGGAVQGAVEQARPPARGQGDGIVPSTAVARRVATSMTGGEVEPEARCVEVQVRRRVGDPAARARRGWPPSAGHGATSPTGSDDDGRRGQPAALRAPGRRRRTPGRGRSVRARARTDAGRSPSLASRSPTRHQGERQHRGQGAERAAGAHGRPLGGVQVLAQIPARPGRATR